MPAAIAATNMHADVDAIRAGQHPVGHFDVTVDQAAPVVAARGEPRLHHGIAEFDECGLVDLHIAATGLCQCRKLLMVGRDGVVPELIHVAVGLRGHCRITAAEMQGAGPGNGDLGNRAGHRLEEGEIVHVDRMRPFELAPDHRSRLGNATGRAVVDLAGHGVRCHVSELRIEIAVIGASPELAVGRELEPELRLQRDGFSDRAILRCGERLAIDFAGVEPLPRRKQRGGSQQAADMLGTKRRMGTQGKVL
jgi:hypothetical protein